MKTLKEKLLQSTVKSKKGCWEWIGGSRGNGYGAIKHEGKVIDTHRVSYMVYKGKIPEGLLVCHTCDNTSCVNPNHLFLGTYSDNAQDCLRKGRMVIPEGHQFEKGHKPLNRKLSDKKVKEVRKFITLLHPPLSLREISEITEVSYDQIREFTRTNQKAYFN
jgi:hypothetical protein